MLLLFYLGKIIFKARKKITVILTQQENICSKIKNITVSLIRQYYM